VHLGRLQGRFDDDGVGDRHPILQLEDVPQRAVEATGSKMRAGGSIDQLSGDAHLPDKG
jgi:hypothetical protein